MTYSCRVESGRRSPWRDQRHYHSNHHWGLVPLGPHWSPVLVGVRRLRSWCYLQLSSPSLFLRMMPLQRQQMTVDDTTALLFIGNVSSDNTSSPWRSRCSCGSRCVWRDACLPSTSNNNKNNSGGGGITVHKPWHLDRQWHWYQTYMCVADFLHFLAEATTIVGTRLVVCSDASKKRLRRSSSRCSTARARAFSTSRATFGRVSLYRWKRRPS